MKSKTSISVGVLAAAVIVLSGALLYATRQKNEIKPAAAEQQKETMSAAKEYTWKPYNITFEYPKDQFIIGSGSQLYIAKVETLPDSDVVAFLTSIRVQPNTTLENVMAEFQKRADLKVESQTTERFGSNTFTKLTVSDSFTGSEETYYFLAKGNSVIEYKVGNLGMEVAKVILPSLVGE